MNYFFGLLQYNLVKEYNIKIYDFEYLINNGNIIIELMNKYSHIDLPDNSILEYIIIIKIYIIYLYCNNSYKILIENINNSIDVIENKINYGLCINKKNYYDFCNANIIKKNNKEYIELSNYDKTTLFKLFKNYDFTIECIKYAKLFSTEFNYDIFISYYYNKKILSDKLYIFKLKSHETDILNNKNYDNIFFYYIKNTPIRKIKLLIQ